MQFKTAVNSRIPTTQYDTQVEAQPAPHVVQLAVSSPACAHSAFFGQSGNLSIWPVGSGKHELQEEPEQV